MAEDLKIIEGNKTEKYKSLVPQIAALLEGEDDPVANMANLCAALRSAMGFFWVGFYLVKGEHLVLGPFQGPVACTRIARGKGVCGTSWQQAKAIIVENVEEFPGHIACSSDSKSEIVIPVYNARGEVAGVLDVDSDRLNEFDAEDENYLKQILQLLKL